MNPLLEIRDEKLLTVSNDNLEGYLLYDIWDILFVLYLIYHAVVVKKDK